MSKQKIPPSTDEQAKLTFPFIRPRAWKNKASGDLVKVVPWFMPFENESQYDLTGLMKEVAPEIFANDTMADFEVYKGLVMRMGWMLETSNGIWIGVVQNASEQFEDIGLWNEEEHRPQSKVEERIDAITKAKEGKHETP